MRVLVIGGAGFIGSHLVDALAGRDHEVTVLDNLSVGKMGNICHHLDAGRVRFVNDTILSPAALDPLVRCADRVFHLAAIVGAKHVVEDPLSYISTNVQGTQHLLQTALECSVRTVSRPVPSPTWRTQSRAQSAPASSTGPSEPTFSTAPTGRSASINWHD